MRRTGYAVVVDQSWPFASVGSEVASQIYEHCYDDMDNKVIRVHNDDIPAPYNRQREQDMLPNAKKIVDAVRSVTYNA